MMPQSSSTSCDLLFLVPLHFDLQKRLSSLPNYSESHAGDRRSQRYSPSKELPTFHVSLSQLQQHHRRPLPLSLGRRKLATWWWSTCPCLGVKTRQPCQLNCRRLGRYVRRLSKHDMINISQRGRLRVQGKNASNLIQVNGKPLPTSALERVSCEQIQQQHRRLPTPGEWDVQLFPNDVISIGATPVPSRKRPRVFADDEDHNAWQAHFDDDDSCVDHDDDSDDLRPWLQFQLVVDDAATAKTPPATKSTLPTTNVLRKVTPDHSIISSKKLTTKTSTPTSWTTTRRRDCPLPKRARRSLFPTVSRTLADSQLPNHESSDDLTFSSKESEGIIAEVSKQPEANTTCMEFSKEESESFLYFCQQQQDPSSDATSDDDSKLDHLFAPKRCHAFQKSTSSPSAQQFTQSILLPHHQQLSECALPATRCHRSILPEKQEAVVTPPPPQMATRKRWCVPTNNHETSPSAPHCESSVSTCKETKQARNWKVAMSPENSETMVSDSQPQSTNIDSPSPNDNNNKNPKSKIDEIPYRRQPQIARRRLFDAKVKKRYSMPQITEGQNGVALVARCFSDEKDGKPSIPGKTYCSSPENNQILHSCDTCQSPSETNVEQCSQQDWNYDPSNRTASISIAKCVDALQVPVRHSLSEPTGELIPMEIVVAKVQSLCHGKGTTTLSTQGPTQDPSASLSLLDLTRACAKHDYKSIPKPDAEEHPTDGERNMEIKASMEEEYASMLSLPHCQSSSSSSSSEDGPSRYLEPSPRQIQCLPSLSSLANYERVESTSNHSNCNRKLENVLTWTLLQWKRLANPTSSWDGDVPVPAHWKALAQLIVAKNSIQPDDCPTRKLWLPALLHAEQP